MKTISSEIKINASLKEVWDVLTNFETYPQWNPFIVSLKGDVIINNRIEVKIQPVGSSAMTFKPMVKAVNNNKEIVWEGNLFFKGLFDGEHSFKLIDNKDNTTTFIQSESFRGILIPFFKNMIENQTLKGFQLMNEKLKEIVENK